MRDEDTYADLTALFSAEDREQEAKPFVDQVMGRIRAQARIRKLLLVVTGVGGALLAASQLPKLLADTVGLDASLTTSIIQVQTDASALASANPLWLGIAAIVGLSLLAVAAMERT
ncbi:hypothetical protein [Hyphomonas johnsonii]|jgi:translation initiation factor 1 (eIF-1/SUI1)|uniref:Uncharacterized protein n=1 Tax=Hyphomonas johnsonii MHS-2 TaxID=1280950 RepID=A0A059FT46_9PROT|nr:hypothetical protein [Hyphomonas johnsonii]KCZ93844.1 hypothetical protein HJO_00675 [Hyphomonas johnsonii MHS-2]